MQNNDVYKGTGLLAVKEGKTLVVLPGTTIRWCMKGIKMQEFVWKMLGDAIPLHHWSLSKSISIV